MAIADLALVNAKVVTVDASSQIAEAVAVRAGRIVAVGTNAEVRAMRPPPRAYLATGITSVVERGGRVAG